MCSVSALKLVFSTNFYFAIELLHKDRFMRMTIKDALDHPWLNNADPTMT